LVGGRRSPLPAPASGWADISRSSGRARTSPPSWTKPSDGSTRRPRSSRPRRAAGGSRRWSRRSCSLLRGRAPSARSFTTARRVRRGHGCGAPMGNRPSGRRRSCPSPRRGWRPRAASTASRRSSSRREKPNRARRQGRRTRTPCSTRSQQRRTRSAMPADLTLESIYTSPKFFGIETATSVQRAICRIAEGRPLEELAEHPDVREAVGGDESLAILAPGSFRPREIDLLCAIRSGKSFFAAAHAFWSAMTARIESLKAGEVPRYPILSVNLRSSEATFAILSGTILARPALRALLVGEVGADSLTLRHPSGRPVECTLAAGARAGANVISVWLAGVTFEEYPRQAGEGGGAVVNYDQQLQAAIGRVVEGGQILSVGSPWAPSGPAYERFASTFGRPTVDRVVVKATGPQMNPTWWTPARCESLQRSNPTAYTTDVLAGFADPS